jgi:hypothetical protein
LIGILPRGRFQLGLTPLEESRSNQQSSRDFRTFRRGQLRPIIQRVLPNPDRLSSDETPEMVLGVERRVEGLNWSGYEYFDWRAPETSGPSDGASSDPLFSASYLIPSAGPGERHGPFQLGLTMVRFVSTSTFCILYR